MSTSSSRRTVTVVFCDLAGSTALGERLDPEPLRAVLARWYDEMRRPLERHGGTVEKFIGDAVMAVFGVPHVHEDDALRAVRAALEMREAAGRLAEALGTPLPLRIGVNSGEVVTGDATTTLVTGDAVNTAKRLEQHAAEDEILVGSTTRRLVENAIRLEPAEPVHAKGKQHPIAAWRVLDAIPDAPAVARRLDAPLVGRSRELDLLLDELAAAERSRSCRLATVVGPAGIGKSRLAAELGALVDDRATVLVTRCIAYGDGITFWPLGQLVHEVGGDEAVARAVAGEPDEDLVLARIRGTTGDAGPAVSTDETFWAFRRLLETLARTRPLVVVVEDVHWAEPTFLDLLEYVAAWTRDVPILLLCLARPELLEERPGWGGGSIALEPLDERESEALLDELAVEWPLAADVRRRISEAAEGNPLFVEQLVAMLAEPGTGDELELPPSIQALLAARLDRLDPLERRVLERAAVVGREFWRGSVVELSPEEERAEVGAALLRLARRELLRPEPSRFLGEDGFRFRHALIRDAAYAEIPKSVRAELHERFALWLESHDGGEELVGYQLEQAHRFRGELGLRDEHWRGLGEQAGELLATAGRRAAARGDMPAAVNLLGRAVALSDRLPLDVRRRLSHALWSTGEIEEAVRLLDEVADEAAAVEDERTLWLARIEGTMRESVSKPDFDADEIVRTCARAIEVFRPLGDDAALARAWLWTAYAHRILGRLEAGSRAAEVGLRHATAAGAADERARLEDELCMALVDGRTEVGEALARCEQLLEEARGSRLGEANVLSAIAELRALAGDFEHAHAAIAHAAGVYEELGLQFALAGLGRIAGDVEVLRGDLDAAETEFRRGLALVATIGARSPLAASLAQVLLDQGRAEEAHLLVADAEDVAGPFYVAQVMWRFAKARLLSSEGRDREAAALARGAVDLAAETDALLLRARTLVVRAQVAATAGDDDAAASAAAQALELYRRKGSAAGERWAAARLPHAAQRS